MNTEKAVPQERKSLMPGIAQRMLANQLRELEEDLIV
ncbi:MAG: winged helix-turn-helix transcriptional regulator [Bacillota bacterium]